MKPIKTVTEKQVSLAKDLLNQIHTATNKNQDIERKLDILNNILGQLVQSNEELRWALALATTKKAPKPGPKTITPQRALELEMLLRTS